MHGPVWVFRVLLVNNLMRAPDAAADGSADAEGDDEGVGKCPAFAADPVFMHARIHADAEGR